VLPFLDLSEKHDQEYFAEGMAEEIIDLLARIPELKVIGRTSSFQFKDKNQDLRAVGSALGVNYVVEGSVRRSNDRLRVAVQLISAQNGSHLWSDTYDAPIGDVLNIQDQIASNLVRALQVSVGAGDFQERASFKTAEAYDLYLRGIHSFDRGDKEGMESAAAYFQQVLDMDPTSAPASDWFAFTQQEMLDLRYVEPREGFEQTLQAAQRALALNPKSSMAYGVLGGAHFRDWDWAEAERDAKESLRLNPRSPGALDALGMIYVTLGRWDEGAPLIDRAISLDPFYADFHNDLAWTLYAAGRLPEAEAEMRKTLQIAPAYGPGHLNLGRVLLREGKLEAALTEMQQEQSDADRNFGLGVVYDMMQRRADSDAALARLIQRHAQDAAFYIAVIYAYRQELDQAFAWIERAYRQKDPSLTFIKVRQGDPRLKRFSQDPRFRSLLRKMNLPE
jgi:TolB-like protein/Flp pilus assembly protein TadD